MHHALLVLQFIPRPGTAQNAAHTPECNPLQTYSLHGMRPVGKFKALISPSRGVMAWHVHHGLFDYKHSEYVALEACAFVLHAVNMWDGRMRPAEFRKSKRMQKLIETGLDIGIRGGYSPDRYAERCLPPGPARQLRRKQQQL